VLASGWKGSSA